MPESDEGVVSLQVPGLRVVCMVSNKAKTRHCDECFHHRATLWNTLHCTKGHTPRWYAPKGTLDQGYGWKRRCLDFEAMTAQTGKRG